MWYDIYVANGDFTEAGSKNIAEIKKDLSQSEIAEARKLSEEWQKNQANKQEMAKPGKSSD
jgi:hypothetical protein